MKARALSRPPSGARVLRRVPPPARSLRRWTTEKLARFGRKSWLVSVPREDSLARASGQGGIGGTAIHRATLVFDLDGTIADTAADLIDAANAALIAEGFRPASAEAIRRGVGYGARPMLDHALRSSGQSADDAQLKRLAERLVQHYEDHIAIKTRLFPGFLETALELRGQGARLALCTNKLDRLVTKLVSALRIAPLFDAKAGRDAFPFHKPDPRHITELVARAGGALPFAIMIGDSEADIAAARGAGIPVFAVRFGYAAVPPDELGADAILRGFEELPDLVGAFLPVGRAA